MKAIDGINMIALALLEGRDLEEECERVVREVRGDAANWGPPVHRLYDNCQIELLLGRHSRRDA